MISIHYNMLVYRIVMKETVTRRTRKSKTIFSKNTLQALFFVPKMHFEFNSISQGLQKSKTCHGKLQENMYKRILSLKTFESHFGKCNLHFSHKILQVQKSKVLRRLLLFHHLWWNPKANVVSAAISVHEEEGDLLHH